MTIPSHPFNLSPTITQFSQEFQLILDFAHIHPEPLDGFLDRPNCRSTKHTFHYFSLLWLSFLLTSGTVICFSLFFLSKQHGLMLSHFAFFSFFGFLFPLAKNLKLTPQEEKVPFLTLFHNEPNSDLKLLYTEYFK